MRQADTLLTATFIYIGVPMLWCCALLLMLERNKPRRPLKTREKLRRPR